MSSARSIALEPRADLAQHLVAGVVAERVVELLEAVEVDSSSASSRRVSAPTSIGGVEPVDQVAAVAEPRQVVGERLVAALAQPLDDRQPGAAIPVSTVTIASTTATSPSSANCPTVSSVERDRREREERRRARRG